MDENLSKTAVHRAEMERVSAPRATERRDAQNSVFNSVVDGVLVLISVALLAHIGLTVFAGQAGPSPSLGQPPADAMAAKSGLDDGTIGLLETSSPFGRDIGAASTKDTRVPITDLNLVLNGVRLSASGQSSVILQAAGSASQTYIVGDEIQPGIRLAGIYKDHVRIAREGRQELLYLDGVEPLDTGRGSEREGD